MSALSGVTVEGPAYLKLMLHTAKYPWASVGGFLLGESAASSTEKARSIELYGVRASPYARVVVL